MSKRISRYWYNFSQYFKMFRKVEKSNSQILHTTAAELKESFHGGVLRSVQRL